ncbi:hypothetical protein CUMW_196810 [Citrus unshiu]|uniref:Uncharacterized protein n=1 Tax=Citrus unshiu TaxID=55188 RepID=A0A2H5Q595_CITUN|nr:hypothetical protein CUMW_196810 [Citrus unshiu]
MADIEGSPGSSMHGVTGREPAFAFSVASPAVPTDTTAKFALPVDSEHKAKVFKLFSLANPHMRTFHLSWISFFTCFVSTFAAAPLVPIIRDNLNLTKADNRKCGGCICFREYILKARNGCSVRLTGPKIRMCLLDHAFLPPTDVLACHLIGRSIRAHSRPIHDRILTCNDDVMQLQFPPGGLLFFDPRNGALLSWGILVPNTGANDLPMATLVPYNQEGPLVVDMPLTRQDSHISGIENLRHAYCRICGAYFWHHPIHVSRRSLGIISGLTGAGGNFWASGLTQLIFFSTTKFSTAQGLSWMGVMIAACTLPVTLVHFPQWGGMFFPPSKDVVKSTEEYYYASEWNEEEKQKGLHQGSLRFAENSRSERGRRVASAPTPPNTTPSHF